MNEGKDSVVILLKIPIDGRFQYRNVYHNLPLCKIRHAIVVDGHV